MVRYAFGAHDAPKLQGRLDELVRLKAEKAADRLPNGAMRDEKGWHALASEAERIQAQLEPMKSGKIAYQTLMNDERDVAIRQGRNVDTTLPIAQKAASDTLRSFGVPGIKYLDGGSRAAGTGSQNFVVFDDALVTILKKYGVALPVIEGLRRKAQSGGGHLPVSDVEGVL